MSETKTSYLSPASAVLEVSAVRSLEPSASITLDLGIPNFTVFSVKFPLPEDKRAFPELAGEALGVMLDEMTAFMLSMGYRQGVIAKVYALAMECYKGMQGQEASGEREPTIGTVRGEFPLPTEFVNETQKQVVTAGKEVRRMPVRRRMEFVPERPARPSKSDVLKAIRRYRFQSIKNTPRPLYLVVYDNMGNPKGTLSLGPGFANDLLKMQYGKKAGSTGLDETIRAGGGVFKGVGEDGRGGEMAYFDNPANNSTLVLPVDRGLTPEAVRRKIEWNNSLSRRTAAATCEFCKAPSVGCVVNYAQPEGPFLGSAVHVCEAHKGQGEDPRAAQTVFVSNRWERRPGEGRVPYPEFSKRREAGQWGMRSYDGDTAHDILDRHRPGRDEAGTREWLGFDEPVPPDRLPALLDELRGMDRSTPDGRQQYLGVAVFLLEHGSEVPDDVRRAALEAAGMLLGDLRKGEQGWKEPRARKQEIKREISLLQGVAKEAAGHPDDFDAIAAWLESVGFKPSGDWSMAQTPTPYLYQSAISFSLMYFTVQLFKGYHEGRGDPLRKRVVRKVKDLAGRPKETGWWVIRNHKRARFGYGLGELQRTLRGFPEIREQVSGQAVAKEGRFLRIEEMRAWGRGEQDRYYAEHPELERIGKAKEADYFDEQGYWAGAGNAASGILPVCTSTGRVCLAWRSPHVNQGSCWGTIGGAVKGGMDPASSARHELAEETGYRGSLSLHPAYVFKSGKFSYHNYIGEVGREFGLRPQGDSAWETEALEWGGLDEWMREARSSPGDFHPGVLALLRESGGLIRSICEKAEGRKAENGQV
jgi:8-oxo-dGTP pyrophosphatase MutT (NUDIX family)